jgi:alpha-D-xyloside xylohydrolase
MRWNDSTAVLTIGVRKGTYPGMVEKRQFQIVLVGSGHGIGGDMTEKADKEIAYDGKEISVNFR